MKPFIGKLKRLEVLPYVIRLPHNVMLVTFVGIYVLYCTQVSIIRFMCVFITLLFSVHTWTN